jgi:CheY-like chemotaxis protein
MTTTDQTILLVEDEEDDVFIMRRALKDAQVANPLQVVTDGQAALDYLTGNGEYADRTRYPLPFLIFLDLKLPYYDGFEILTRIRQQSALKSIIVVVLTSSAELRDKDRAYQLGARSYLIKPPTVKTLNEVFNALKSYWLSKAEVTPIVASKN